MRFTPRSPIAQVAAVLVLLAALAGCGVRLDDTPRSLGIATSSTLTPTPTSVVQQPSFLFSVRDGDLLPYTRQLPDQLPFTVLSELSRTRSSGIPTQDAGTSIPVGTQVLSAERNGDTLAINLSSRFNRATGATRQQAIAQFVLTATGLAEVKRVQFLVNGSPITISTPENSAATLVTDCDFESLLADPDTNASSGLSARAAIRLTELSDDLAQRCN